MKLTMKIQATSASDLGLKLHPQVSLRLLDAGSIYRFAVWELTFPCEWTASDLDDKLGPGKDGVGWWPAGSRSGFGATVTDERGYTTALKGFA